MATDPRDRLENEKDRIRRLADEGELSAEIRDRLLEFAVALDGAKVRHKFRDDDGQVTEYKPRTVERYLQCARLGFQAGIDPLATTPEEINRVIDRLHDEEGKAKTTLIGYQCGLQRFFRYHDDLGVDPDAIHVYSERSDARHDETDMFTEEEVDALRRACGQTELPTRNRALLELLIFTGQRIGALLTLRIRDVDVEEGYIYLNDEYADDQGGLKGALVRGRKRPIFGARKYVRDWLEYHPRGDDPDAWLFIGNPSHWKTDPDDHWAKVSASHVLQRIGEYAGVDKPVNPHNFRHYCATVLYRDYDLDRDTIRMLFGHVEGSSALENTYSHVFDEDYIEKAEAALGYREREPSNPLTPDSCPTCGELLQDDWRQCPNCQEVFGPGDDFAERVAEFETDATAEAISSRDPEEIEALEAILDAVDDPAALADALADLDE